MTETVDQTDIWPYDCHPQSKFARKSCTKYSTASLRRLDRIFLGGYLPSLSINYVAMSKDMEKKLTQLYYIKMKISYDLGFIAIGVALAT